MSNTIASELQLTTVLDTALEAFRRAIMPLSVIGAVFDDIRLNGDGTMTLPYYPLATSASQSRAAGGSYKALATATTTNAKQITPNRNKVQAISFTSEEFRRQPRFDPERHGRLKGEKLAFDIIADILSVLRYSDFSSDTIAATTAANFDESDVTDLAQKCVEGYWPDGQRSLVLNPAFYFNLLKQPPVLDASQSLSDAALREAMVKRLMGFDIIGSAGMVTNNGDAFSVVGEADNDTFTAAAHGLADGDRVFFPNLEGGSGLTEVTTEYFVRDAATNTFKVTATVGGAAVNFTTDVTSGSTCRKYENLAGAAFGPSGILIGFSPIEPTDGIKKKLVDWRIVNDRASNIVLEYKRIAYEDTDEEAQIIEAHYGFSVGEPDAVKLLRAANPS
jgi:hypothetical protein